MTRETDDETDTLSALGTALEDDLGVLEELREIEETA